MIISLIFSFCFRLLHFHILCAYFVLFSLVFMKHVGYTGEYYISQYALIMMESPQKPHLLQIS